MELQQLTRQMQKAASLFTIYIIVFLFSSSNEINPDGHLQQVSWWQLTKTNFKHF